MIRTIKLKSMIRTITKEVQGETIKFKGYEDFDFFCYQLDGNHLLDECLLTLKQLKGKYLITEGKTGKYCGEPASSPEEAYYNFSQKLKQQFTPERLAELIEGVCSGSAAPVI